MMGSIEIITGVSLAAFYPAFAFSHSVYSEKLTDIPFVGLYGIVARNEKRETNDRSKREGGRLL